ncbi:MAG TPA: metallophosphoesterase [Allosphingosinicella sp.]|nr:metallophosphoesterase [Allosphingosinicella sp.]
MRFLRKVFKRQPEEAAAIAFGPAGERAYVIGDIHGRLDLLEVLLARIEQDVRRREPRRNRVVFLGDLVDRGPDSAGVVERLRTYNPDFAEPVFLAGNHEELFLRILRGDTHALAQWLKFGGAECVESYGVRVPELLRLPRSEALALLQASVPASHIAFLEQMADTYGFGQYLFVHAGIRPGIALEEQKRADLRWIRDPFLSFDGEHDFVVVHGHTIVDQVQERRNRIGIDTGAYRSGLLTALAIEDDRRWYLFGELSGAEVLPAA